MALEFVHLSRVELRERDMANPPGNIYARRGDDGEWRISKITD